MNLSAPSHQTHENNSVSATIKGPAILRRGIAGNFLEPSLHNGRVQPAASSLFEKNHVLFLGGLRFGVRSPIGNDRCAHSLFQRYADAFLGAQRDAGQWLDTLMGCKPDAVMLRDR